MRDAVMRQIPGWDDYYASEEGIIYSLRASRGREFRPLKPGTGNSGYDHVILCQDGEQRVCRVHVLVTEAFHGPRPEKSEASHKNGNRRDNRPENLTWETSQENKARKKDHGTTDKGLRNSRCSVTKESLKEIRNNIEEGKTNKEISEMFNISTTTVSRIRSGRRFSDD